MILKAFAILVLIITVLLWCGALFGGDNSDSKALALLLVFPALVCTVIDAILWFCVIF